MQRAAAAPMKLLSFLQNDKALLTVIPHRSLLNSNNRRLWHVLHEVLAVHDRPGTRIQRVPGVGVTYRIRDDLWWIVDMRGLPPKETEGECRRRVQFHLAVPARLQEVVSIKWANHPQWNHCAFAVPDPDALLLTQHAALYRLRLTRHDMFSLAFDYAEQASPLREVLHVLYELQPGDAVQLRFRFQAMGRPDWRERVDYAWQVWTRGGMPQRAGFSPARLWRTALRGAAGASRFVMCVADDVLAGIERSFYRAKDGADSQATMLPLFDAERQALLMNGDLSQRTYGKRNLPVFAAGLYVVVDTPNDERREMLAHSVASAFAGLAGDNSLALTQVRPSEFAHVAALQAPEMDLAPDLLSTDEIGKLVQLPTAELQEHFGLEMASSRAVEINVPRSFLDSTGIFMGTAGNRGETFDVYVPTGQLAKEEYKDKVSTARIFIGSPRMGKDMATVNLIVESCLNHGIGAVIPDVIDERNGHRGMADAVRDHLPADKVIDLDLGDFDYPIYVGPADIPTAANKRVSASFLADLVTEFYLGEDVLTLHQSAAILRECAKIVRGDPLGIKLLLTNKDYRTRKLAEARQLRLDVTNMEDYHALGERGSDGKQGQIAAPIFVRLGMMTSHEALRPMFCQRPNPAASLTEWMKAGRVVIYRIPNREIGPMGVQLLVHWLVMTVFITKQAMNGAGALTWLILNEPHQFLSPGLVVFLERLLAEGPKHRLAPVFLLQNFKLLKNPRLVELIKSASLNWHIFKNSNISVYQELEKYLAPTFEPGSAMDATPAYHYIASWLNMEGAYEAPFLVAAPPEIWKRFTTRDNSELTRTHSRTYGRHIDDVLDDIDRRCAGKEC